MTTNDKNYQLSSTQLGVIAEHLVANSLIRCSAGRLSPFRPVADDDGIDLLIFDKLTRSALALQVKSRAATLKKKNSEQRGNVCHFEIRKATFQESPSFLITCVLLNNDLTAVDTAWLIPAQQLPSLARDTGQKWVIRPNKLSGSNDQFRPMQHHTASSLATTLITYYA